jgi:hypothetical protein
VLHRVCGKLFIPEDLRRIFSSTRLGRALDRAGYARFRRWRVYAERGLGSEPVAVLLHDEHLTQVYQDEPLAQYRVVYQPDQRRRAGGDAGAALRDPSSLAAFVSVDRGRGRLAASAAAAGLRAAAATTVRCGAAAPLLAGRSRRLSRTEGTREASPCHA